MKNIFQETINKLSVPPKENRLQSLKRRLFGQPPLSRKKLLFWLAGSFLLVAILLFLFFRPWLGRSWLEYPLSLRAELAWQKWQETFLVNCYDACLRDRAIYTKIIAAAWQAETVDWSARAENWLKTADSNEASQAIIDLSSVVFSAEQAPLIWRQAVQADWLDNIQRSYIIQRFAPSFQADQDLFFYLSHQTADNTLNIENRQAALSALVAFPNRQTLDFFLSILASAEGPILKREVLAVLAAWPLSQTPIKEKDLEFLGRLALDPGSGLELRPRLVWLLADYYSLFPATSVLWLEKIYWQKELDVFSRGFAADSLKQLIGAELVLPEVSAADWELYYSIY